IDLTDARTHDRKALKLDRWLNNQLLLLDRGYSDHSLFAEIERRKGFSLTPLKTTSIPTITKIRCGLGQRHVGKALVDDLPYCGDLDIDATFSIRGARPKTLRVVGVSVLQKMEDGSSQYVDLWLVTNLSPEVISAEQLATLYRLRWDVEILFKITSGVVGYYGPIVRERQGRHAPKANRPFHQPKLAHSREQGRSCGLQHAAIALNSNRPQGECEQRQSYGNNSNLPEFNADVENQ
ncbi:MAG: transposase, partial [Myxococcales bacterium]|nr:transposase [Myxococcales bacterium]